MKTFSRLSLFTLVCFGIALMLVGNTADAQENSLEVLGKTGDFEVGSEVTVQFIAGTDGVFDPGTPLYIEAKNVNITSHTPIPGSHNTGAAGILVVKGKITAAAVANGAYISATWGALFAQADFGGEPPPADPTMIVVGKPDKSPLKIGDSFTQEIKIKGIDSVEDVDLAAWQLSVVYNTAVLEPTDIAQGTFLPADAPFAHTALADADGEITVSQTVLLGSAGMVGDGSLLTLTFMVLEIADEPLGIHNVLLLNSADAKLTYSISVEGPAIVEDSFMPEDVNRDRKVDILDLVMVAAHIGTASTARVDVNGDGFVNIMDLVMVAAKYSAAGPAPFANVEHMNSRTIQDWIDLAQVEDDGSAIFDHGIANLEALLTSQIPSQTKLLLNYPNPFNPETWIPYQLAKASDVTVMIHSMNGSLIRTLALGHQAAGIYKSKSQAAYWDGHNELGEHVASGLYFYTLTAGKFSATGKMLVRK